MSGPCILLSAVEGSGDALGAELMRAMRRRLGAETRFIGVGGPLMAREGLKSAFDIAELSVLGFVEGLTAFPRAARRAGQLARLAVRERADAAVLIDSWGFSYLLARRLRRRLPGLPLIKYVAPQVWASRPGRARALARTFDLVLSIVAFEPPILERAGAKVVFVGHPALARDFAKADPARLRARIEAEEEDPILLVLPGSRRAEVERLAPPFEAALRRLKAERPALKVVVSVAPTVAALVREKTARWPGVHLIEDETGKDDAMRAATVALACSGTATTELAAAGCPMVVAYKLGPLTYAIGRRIVRVRYITLFNIAADAEVAPELIQDEATGARIAREIALRLDDKPRRERQIAAQNAALELLGGRGPAPGERAAMAIAEILAAQPRLSMGT